MKWQEFTIYLTNLFGHILLLLITVLLIGGYLYSVFGINLYNTVINMIGEIPFATTSTVITVAIILIAYDYMKYNRDMDFHSTLYKYREDDLFLQNLYNSFKRRSEIYNKELEIYKSLSSAPFIAAIIGYFVGDDFSFGNNDFFLYVIIFVCLFYVFKFRKAFLNYRKTLFRLDEVERHLYRKKNQNSRLSEEIS